MRAALFPRQQISVTNSASVAMLAVALALGDQVPQVRHRHVGTMQGDQRFFSVLAAPVTTRADHPNHCFRILPERHRRVAAREWHGYFFGSVFAPSGYKTSISICRKFLNEHAPKKADGETAGKIEPKPVSPAQMLYAKKIAQGKGVIIPDEAKANSAAMSAWIGSNRGTTRRKCGRKTACKAYGINCASIDSADEKVSETYNCRRCRRPANPRNRDATADSLWQQGGRSEAWRTLRLGGMVCPAWSRSCCIRRAGMAITT